MLLLNELIAVSNDLLSAANIRFLHNIINCFYCVQKDITVRSLSRFSEYSTRSFFRFLKTNVDWVSLRIALVQKFVINSDDNRVYILALDETVEGKSRKKTYGMSKFFSSTLDKVVDGISFSAISLIDTTRAVSYMLGVEQLTYTDKDKARILAQKEQKKEAKKRQEAGEAKPKGRQKGSKNKTEKEPDNPSFRAFKSLLDVVMSKLKTIKLPLCYFVADSAFAALHHVKEVQKHGLHLISKMAYNTALHKARPKKRGNGTTGGERYDLYNLDEAYLKETRYEADKTIKVYQIQALNPSLKDVLLNVVVILSISKAGEKKGIKILFCTDLGLSYDLVEKYYSLRFQIEFDFDDAKHRFGLSSFKNYKEQNVTNFVNMIFFMCTYNKIALEKERKKSGNENLSVNDLKIIQNYRFIAKSVINKVRKRPDLIFNSAFWDNYSPEISINRA